jgi:hypothetical protein
MRARERVTGGTHLVSKRPGLAVVLAAALGLASLGLHAQSTVAPEYNVKAGFLTTFINYTIWPEERFESPAAPIVICVLGSDPFGDVLDRTATLSRTGRSLRVRRVRTLADTTPCHLVFISRAEGRREASWLTFLRRRMILTVGESGQTIERGGIVEFVTVGGSVRFDVGLPAMEQARIRLSSDMLAHARQVLRAPVGSR